MWGGLICFPSAISLFGYMYTISYYGFSIFLAVFSVWIVEKNENKVMGSVISIVAIACSMGIYQAYIGFTITTFTFILLKYTITDNGAKLKNYIIRSLHYVFLVFCGLGLYVVLYKLFLKVMNVQLVAYQNLSSMGQMSFKELLEGMKASYINFLQPNPDVFPARTRILFFVLFVLIGMLYIYVVVKLFRKHRFLDVLWSLLCLAVLPLGLNCIYYMGADWIYSLMLYANAMFLVMPCIFLDYIDYATVKKTTVICVCAVLLYYGAFLVTYSNRCYLDATYTQSKTISWMNSLIAQIKSTEGFREDMNIMFLGEMNSDDMTFDPNTEYDVGITHYGNYDVINSYNWKKFMYKWCGFSMPEVNQEQAAIISQKEEVLQMPSYPNDGSIKIIDDVVVVKFK